MRVLVGMTEKEGPSAAALRWAREMASRLGAAAPVDVEEVDATGGDAEKTIVDRARDTGADMVVVGADRNEGVTSLGLHSLGHSLAHHLPCPLISVPETARPPEGRWFVVGIDGSDASRVALHWAEGIAQPIGAQVCALYVIDDLYDTYNTGGWYGREELDARREAHREFGRIEFKERTGEGAPTIEDEADERDAALLVVAARQRRSLYGHVLGRVPDHLLHDAARPVAVLPYEFVKDHLGPAAGATT
jgi:nucleotide-binding universal stress UspA family protein